MRAMKFKLWRSASAAAVLAVAACGGEAGESGSNSENGEAGESGAVAPAPSAATATAPAGGEQGEAGAAQAYAGLRGTQVTAVRLQHLKGFLLIAQRVAATSPDDAAVLIGQGLLEVYDPAQDQFGGLNAAPVRAAAEASGLTPAQMGERINAAIAAIDAARPEHEAAAVAARMVDIAAGLYQGVVQEDFVDPIEYQHSLGAALGARDALVAAQGELTQEDRAAYAEASAELDRLIALWPNTSAPETPASYRQVLAQTSRVRLALSPYL